MEDSSVLQRVIEEKAVRRRRWFVIASQFTTITLIIWALSILISLALISVFHVIMLRWILVDCSLVTIVVTVIGMWVLSIWLEHTS